MFLKNHVRVAEPPNRPTMQCAEPMPACPGIRCDRESGHTGNHGRYIEEHDDVIVWSPAKPPVQP